MSLAAAAYNLQPTACSPPDWLPASIAATRLGKTTGAIRLLCERTWSMKNLAKKENGQWFVSRLAHALLRDNLYGREQDLQQIAQLAAQGVKKKYLAAAVARRDILTGFPAFALQSGTTNAHRQLALYRAHLRASKTKAPSRGTFIPGRRPTSPAASASSSPRGPWRPRPRPEIPRPALPRWTTLK